MGRGGGFDSNSGLGSKSRTESWTALPPQKRVKVQIWVRFTESGSAFLPDFANGMRMAMKNGRQKSNQKKRRQVDTHTHTNPRVFDWICQLDGSFERIFATGMRVEMKDRRCALPANDLGRADNTKRPTRDLPADRTTTKGADEAKRHGPNYGVH